jgi:hypothetical protein
LKLAAYFGSSDEASPALRVILKQVRDLNVALDKARRSSAPRTVVDHATVNAACDLRR